MTTLSTAEDINNVQAVPLTSSNVLDAKSLGDKTILVTSTEVTSASSSECQSDNDAESLTISENHTTEQLESATAENVDINAVPVVPQADIFTAIKVLQVIETYGASGENWPGLADFVPLVTEQILAGEPVQLVFTGFGFKSSPAGGEVLGELPDLGEKLALGHLDGLCSNIARVYEKGAEVHICCNGLVYNGESQYIQNRCLADIHRSSRGFDRDCVGILASAPVTGKIFQSSTCSLCSVEQPA
jgi:hypothetical protein